MKQRTPLFTNKLKTEQEIADLVSERLTGIAREDPIYPLFDKIGTGIKHVVLKNDILTFTWEDGTEMTVQDVGQSCCESRYMRTDDDLGQFTDCELTGVEIKPVANSNTASYGEHDIAFFEVRTSKGWFTMASHNEHNGYYGGFSLTANEVK